MEEPSPGGRTLDRSLSTIVLTVLSAPDLKTMLASEAPIADFLRQTGGPLAAAIVSLGVLAAVFNNLIAAGLGLSRLIFSTGRDEVWGAPVNRLLSGLNCFRAPWGATTVLIAVAALRLRKRSGGWLTAPVTDTVVDEPLPNLPPPA